MILSAEVNHFVMRKLNELKISCRACQQEYAYRDKDAHWRTCVESWECNLDGCEDGGYAKNQAGLRGHWETDCESAKVTCSGCGSEISRRDSHGHDCFTFLKRHLVEQTQYLERQKDELRALTGKDPDNKEKYPMHCYKMHRIKRYPAGEQNRRKSKVTG